MLVHAGNAFSLALYRRLAGERGGENLFLSPYSMSNALMMVAEGARGETAGEMGTALCFPDALRQGDGSEQIPWDMGPLHEGLAALSADLRSGADDDDDIRREIAELRTELERINRQAREQERHEVWSESCQIAEQSQEVATRLNALLAGVDQYEIRVANALWAERTCPFRPEFLETIDDHYGTGGACAVDFRTDHEAVRKRINEWVEDQTNRRIRDLVPPDALGELTRLVVVNAIYFKGEWSEPFPERDTKPLPFLLADGGTSEIDMMSAWLESASYAAFEADGTFFETPREVPPDLAEDEGPVRYPGDGGFCMVELPYKGGRLSMVLIAPNRRDGLPDLEEALTPAAVEQWIDRLEPRQVDVVVPRFQLQTCYEMTNALQALGMVRAFNDPRERDGAQFTAMTTSTDPAEQLYVSAVLHKAFLEVNERGTEAAAATVVGAVAAGAPLSVPFVPAFRADRPFVFMIRDTPTGAILFLGRMTRSTGA
jgi:serine protease inhibitor